jgi:tRNA A37 threonylcarbamoyladenosine modification protein TsaB
VTARTLAQQLEIPLFAISSLEAIAWQEQKRALNQQDIAVQMPAQRGEVFGAIYQPSGELGLKTLLPDAVFNPDLWQNTLEGWANPYRLVTLEGGTGASAASLLELAYFAWQQGECPHWSEALPFYGQHPVDVGS